MPSFIRPHPSLPATFLMKKATQNTHLGHSGSPTCRSGGIRTRGLLVPKMSVSLENTFCSPLFCLIHSKNDPRCEIMRNPRQTRSREAPPPRPLFCRRQQRSSFVGVRHDSVTYKSTTPLYRVISVITVIRAVSSYKYALLHNLFILAIGKVIMVIPPSIFQTPICAKSRARRVGVDGLNQLFDQGGSALAVPECR